MLNLSIMTPSAVELIRRNLEEYKTNMDTADNLADRMYDEETPADEVRILDMMWEMAYSIAKDSKAKLARSIAVFSKGEISKEKALEMVSDGKNLDHIDALLKRFAA